MSSETLRRATGIGVADEVRASSARVHATEDRLDGLAEALSRERRHAPLFAARAARQTFYGRPMDAELLWVTPLLLLPGVGLLVMSTAARFGQIHEEIHHVLTHPDLGRPMTGHLWRRCRLFRDALVSLYAAVALFAVASLAGGLIQAFDRDGRWVTVTLTCFGIVAIVYGVVQLIRESTLLLDVFKGHLEEIERR